ncbi:MAG: DUF2203 domain-containing protein [Planctomycetes bacterium]|nr:DUF2203 domain-containing protein [Planctomycetota bacterium]
MSVIRFSASEATARLVFVAPAATEATELASKLRAAQVTYEAEKRRPLASQALLNDTRRSIELMRREIAACVADIALAGAVLDDPARGTVDFPGVLDGRPACLCWRAGDERVENWHAEGESHDRRRALPVPVAADAA